MKTTRSARRLRHGLVSATAWMAVLVTTTTAMAVDLAVLTLTRKYDRPRFEGYRVDACDTWSANCGKGAADHFCKIARGYGSVATAFEIENGIGHVSPTRTLGDRKICAQSFCGGFLFVTCGQPAPLLAKAPKDACNVSKKKEYAIGNKKYLRGALVGEAALIRPEEKKQSKITGKVVVCFAGYCDNLGEAFIEGSSAGKGRAHAQAGGKVFVDDELPAGQGGKDLGPYAYEKKMNGTITIVPGVTAGGYAAFLAGAELHGGYDLRSFPPLADMSANGKAYANGSANGSLKVMGGLIGWVKASSVINVPSPEVIADMDTRTCGSKADARVDVKAWQLSLGVSGAVGCLLDQCLWKGSKILINKQGARTTYDLF